ncbi:glycosyltransferase family 9 protein [Chamaesiphon sp. VAR_48_metabat_403]|uniref:glycosyltransferase family 9 protein n=1 Tax=Chamaesiphon sp. VAR_48_metabat_403 TaxID=2964700 RepID=UPI00286D7F3C|nr:glycosyltransferase family 9 protein [Chamaesiphon sp. VAR_48_metabat_403]
MRILALVPGGIGDQILFFPTIDNLKGRYPDAEIDVVVEPRSTTAYRVSKSVHKVIPFDFKDVNGPADWGNLLGIIRDSEYDVAMSLGRRFGVGLLLWLTGIPVRIGFDVGASKLFLSNPVTLNLNQYAAQMFHDLVGGLGITDPCPAVSINVPKSDLDWAEAAQDRLGIKDSGYVLIHGGENKPDRIYPVKQWQQIVKDLQTRQPNIPVAVIKGPDDGEFIEALLTLCPALKVISPPDIGKLAATIAGANLMLCTNSGPMHLAVAVGTYTIALFGPSDPAKLLPNNGRSIAIKSRSGKIADIPPSDILEKIWKG